MVIAFFYINYTHHQQPGQKSCTTIGENENLRIRKVNEHRFWLIYFSTCKGIFVPSHVFMAIVDGMLGVDVCCPAQLYSLLAHALFFTLPISPPLIQSSPLYQTQKSSKHKLEH